MSDRSDQDKVDRSNKNNNVFFIINPFEFKSLSFADKNCLLMKVMIL
ncbi:MAG: hypothetical protein Q9M94_05940 [Candidatus Gracilibacteria bacterium]|nr:hypothetical protein [Candidatus Gracilibacteria bacterium]